MKSRKSWYLAGILLMLFIGWTALVSFVDVRAIGPEQSTVGLATLNQFVFEHLGVHLWWDGLTDGCSLVAILVACSFALLGLLQLLQRKSLRKVDPNVLLLCGLYVALVAVYLLFECVVINCRPILMDGQLEASYPSSHTMMVLCILASAMIAARSLLATRKALRVALNAFAVLVMAVTVAGRLVSGVHWLTDIVGGLLISAALVALYGAAVQTIAEKQGKSI